MESPADQLSPAALAPFLDLRFEAIGTAWSVQVFEPLAPGAPGRLERAIHARVNQFDAHYSRFRNDSLVAQMASAAGTYNLPPDAQPLFDLYRDLYDRTAGAMTPLIGQTLSDAGYDAAYSLKQSRPLTKPPAWSEILDYDFPQLTLARPALLDLGAAGKGYLVDLVAGLLEGHGLTAYCVDAGGDLRYRHPATASQPSGPPLRVGLEHPADPTQVVGVAELDGSATGGREGAGSSPTSPGISLCGSAGNRRAWGEYHHILDPRILTSPRHLQAVWVVADSTLLADALTTALFLVDATGLTSYYDFEYALIRADATLEHSAGFPAEFFTV